jgi:flagellar FliL protein
MAKDEDVKKDKDAEPPEKEGAEGAEGTEGKKKGKFSPKALLANKRKLIMIVAPLIIVIILGAVFFLKSSGDDAPEVKKEGAVEAKVDVAIDEDVAMIAESETSDFAEGGETIGRGNMLEMKSFVVNLQDNSGTRYLKLTIGVELNSLASKKQLENLKPRVRNSMIILLSSKSYTEIGSIQGKYKLRDEIVDRINHILGGEKVETVYFTEFVVQ